MTNETEISGLIDQAKSQARGDAVKNFISNNKKNVTTFTVVGTIALVIFLIFNFYQKSQERKFSKILHQSLIDQQIGDLAKAQESLKKIYETESAPGGVRSLAGLRYAGLLLNEGKSVEAIKVYQTINECGSCDSYAKDLAGLLLVKFWIMDASENNKEDLGARIEKIENKSKILKYQIAEQRAWFEMQKNNLEKSRQIFESIAKNPEAPQVVKARAADGLRIISGR